MVPYEYLQNKERTTTMTQTELYSTRLSDIIATVNHIEPKRVPVVAYHMTWPVGYKDVDIEETFNSTEKFVDVFSSVFEDVYADAQISIAPPNSLKANKMIGARTFTISPDKRSFQHTAIYPMEYEDYPEVIKNHKKWHLNVGVLRKFPMLTKMTKQEVKELFISIAFELERTTQSHNALKNKVQKDYSIVPLTGGGFYNSPFDLIFDRLRGFKNTLVDIRRCPQQVLDLVEAVKPEYINPLNNIKTNFPYFMCFPHAPSFLGPARFEKFYWPTLKVQLNKIIEMGQRPILALEGTWQPLLEIMADGLPDNGLIVSVENDEPREVRRVLGKKAALLAGVPSVTMKYENEETCKDCAKKLIDDLAPGGGFLYAGDKGLMTVKDIDTKNYIAIQKFVHEYGKY
ncbi:MAG: hypothetical protein ACOWWR_07410 [Eubacteriales bacterium]